MKQLITILLSTILLLSCSKDKETDKVIDNVVAKKYCWECTIKTYISISPNISGSGYPQTIYSDSKHCDLTELQIKEVISKSESTVTQSVQGYTSTVNTSMTCNKQK